MTSQAMALSVEEIRGLTRSRKEQWQKFLKYIEGRVRAFSHGKMPTTKKGYLVLLFEGAELDLLLDLDSGEIYEIVDGRFKWFLMNHHRVHPDVKPLLALASDSRVLAFASYTCGLDPKFAKELFNKNATTAFVEKDEDGVVRHYYYDLTKRKGNPEIVLGAIVICKDEKPKKAKRR